MMGYRERRAILRDWRRIRFRGRLPLRMGKWRRVAR